jgi:predicted AAA+ superfamily ATPase
MNNYEVEYTGFMKYIERFIKGELDSVVGSARITELLGARQVGKSTLLRNYADEKGARYLSLDDALMRDFASNDPKTFLTQYKNGPLIIDEVQLVPDLIPALKLEVDINPDPGRYIISGSADLSNLSSIHESLAGRAQIVNLYGFSQDELLGKKSVFLQRLFDHHLDRNYSSSYTTEEYKNLMAAGGYPEIQRQALKSRNRWYQNYLRLIFNRDAKDISELRRLSDLPKILRYIASTAGHELVLSNIANDCGIPRSTLAPYIDLLDTLFLTKRLDAWSMNLTSRVVSHKKSFLLDSGLAWYLSGGGDNKGGVFEAFVYSELLKQASYNDAQQLRFYHFRDYQKKEIDLIIEDEANDIVGIEVKLSATPKYSNTATLREMKRKHGKKMLYGLVVYTGQDTVDTGDDIAFVPASIIWESF